MTRPPRPRERPVRGTRAAPHVRPFRADAAQQYPAVIGCDEVGRGALCGPVVVAAVWFEPAHIPSDLLEALDDSKRLPAPVREEITERLEACARIALAASSARRIDRWDIRATTLEAMQRAVARLALTALVMVDGRDVPPGLRLECQAVIKGDGTVPQIAAASIVAKTVRDRLMRRLDPRYPAYGWARNAGYATADHLAAIEEHGLSPHHRLSFGAQLALPL